MTSPVIATLLAGLAPDASGVPSLSAASRDQVAEMLARLEKPELKAQLDELLLFGYFLEMKQGSVVAADQVIQLVEDADPDLFEKVREAMANLGQQRLEGAHAEFARFQDQGGTPVESDAPKIRLSDLANKPISG